MKRWMTRRRFLAATGAAFGAGAATLAYARWVEPQWVQVVERELELPGVAPRWKGRSVALVTDLHVGPRVDSDFLRHWMGWLADRSPDAVVLVGDFMSCTGNEQVANAVEVVTHLRPEETPVFASLGNHDYAYGWRNTKVADELAAGLTAAGVHVLRNAAFAHDGLPLAGLEDLWSPRFDEATSRDTLAAGHGLALAHNPDTADLPLWSGFRGSILSGHTHGGQVRAPLYGPIFLPVRNRDYIAGSYHLDDDRRLYISRGLGHSHRVRLLTRPEITLFRIDPV